MIVIGAGDSRPASKIPIPGTSHATASSAGACVTAAKAHPVTPGRERAGQCPRAAIRPPCVAAQA